MPCPADFAGTAGGRLTGAKGLRPLHPCGCAHAASAFRVASGTRRRACPGVICSPLPLPVTVGVFAPCVAGSFCLHQSLLPPSPPTPFPSGEGGEPKLSFARGYRPLQPCNCAHAASAFRVASGTRRRACPGVICSPLPLPVTVGVFAPCVAGSFCLHRNLLPPSPRPALAERSSHAGEGGDLKFIFARGFAPCIPAAAPGAARLQGACPETPRPNPRDAAYRAVCGAGRGVRKRRGQAPSGHRKPPGKPGHTGAGIGVPGAKPPAKQTKNSPFPSGEGRKPKLSFARGYRPLQPCGCAGSGTASGRVPGNPASEPARRGVPGDLRCRKGRPETPGASTLRAP